ncbi:Uncharacterized protein TPAR_05824 [Tolypocladium paradoxum]|uniref:14-3-3 domain-containing protein n=1 Tax=Tolypocladium paradoxum TaxID=94208 RepID=A0A2S4KUX6_9HYPO|nr:Uncharacterized protein TPAR_05824 [Tolypocladium paradoxum]
MGVSEHSHAFTHCPPPAAARLRLRTRLHRHLALVHRAACRPRPPHGPLFPCFLASLSLIFSLNPNCTHQHPQLLPGRTQSQLASWLSVLRLDTVSQTHDSLSLPEPALEAALGPLYILCAALKLSGRPGLAWPQPDCMASSEVDQKFLGRLARAVENDNPLLSSILFKILGLSLNLAEQLVAAKKQRRPDPTASPLFLKRVLHILWLSREGLVMLQQYVIPMVGNYVELKVLAYKLRASFHHIFVLFHNHPPVSSMASWTPDLMAAAADMVFKANAKKGGDTTDDDAISRPSSVQPTHPLEGGPVGPPPGFESHVALLPPSFLLPAQDYLPAAHQYFKDASRLADSLLWGSHSLRLSVKTEYAAFLYDCVHDADASRKLAKETIAEVYDATEGMDDDMFSDACELVTVLGKMMKRGLGSNNTLGGKGRESNPALGLETRAPPPGMENPI